MPHKKRIVKRKGVVRQAITARQSLADGVYESLLESIVGGTLLPGTILSAVELSMKLDVSRTPIHDALRALAADGVVELQTGRRARVARFTRDDLWEIFEMRRFLEGPAAELAARRMDERQLVPLRREAAELVQIPTAVDWTRRWSDFDDLFHAEIALGSGLPRLARDINRYRLLHRSFNRIAADRDSLQYALNEHLRILDALEAHDGPRARREMEAHIRAWQQYFADHFPSQPS